MRRAHVLITSLLAVCLVAGQALSLETPKGKTATEFVKEAKATVSAASPEALKSLMESGQEYVLLDIRSFAEFDENGWINGRTVIPHGMVIFKAKELIPNKAVPIVVYCKKGKRSSLVAAQLWEMGYENVKYLDGGVMVWARKGYPVEKQGKSHIASKAVVTQGQLPAGRTAEDFVAEANKVVRAVNPRKVYEVLKGNQDAVLIDVRTKPEIAEQGSIQGALVMEHGKVPFNIQKKVHDANTPLFVICKKGGRSALLAKMLTEMGYKDVHHVDGGILAWKEARVAMGM